MVTHLSSMKKADITTGVLYAIRVRNYSGGWVLPGVVLAKSGMRSNRVHPDVGPHLTYACKQQSIKDALVLLQASVWYSAGGSSYYQAPLDIRRAKGVDHRNPYFEPSDELVDETKRHALMDRALASTKENPVEEGFALYTAEPREILGPWDKYWEERLANEAAEAEVAAAAEVEAQRVWDEAAAPLIATHKRLAKAGLVEEDPRIGDRAYSYGRSPATTVTLPLAQVNAMLDALGPDWTFNPDPPLDEDGWSWTHRAGQ